MRGDGVGRAGGEGGESCECGLECFERVCGGGGVGPVGGVLGEHLLEGVPQRPGDVVRSWGWLVEVAAEHGDGAAAGEGGVAGEQLVAGDAGGVDVGGRGGAFVFGEFGRHVFGGADDAGEARRNEGA